MLQFNLLQFAALHNVAIQFAAIPNCSKIIVFKLHFIQHFLIWLIQIQTF